MVREKGVNSVTHINTLLVYLKYCERTVSKHHIAKLAQLSPKKFAKKLSEIQNNPEMLMSFFSPRSYRIILDYVLISREMKVINRPFNYLVNHHEKRLIPTQNLLVAVIEFEGRCFPISMAWWIQECFLDDDEIHQKQTEVSEKMLEKLHQMGFQPEVILFDGAFLNASMMGILKELNWPVICRFPKNRNCFNLGEKQNPKKLFSERPNGLFYFYKKVGYMSHKRCVYASQNVEIIVNCNTKEKLNTRDFYCILNTSELSYTEAFRAYKNRSKIEHMFKILKSYLGMLGFFRHHQDYLECHYRSCFSAFILLQSMAQELNLTMPKTLLFIRKHSLEELNQRLSTLWCDLKQIVVGTTFQKTQSLKHIL